MNDDYLYETIQMFWPVSIEPLDEDKWLDDDYDGPTYSTPEEQLPLLPDIFDSFSTSWQSMNSPHSDQFPKGVRVHGVFFTFDKELGVCVCANYKVKPEVLHSTKKFKHIVNAIAEDIESGFDSWLNTHFYFKHDGKRFSISGGASAKRIVAPVEGYDQLFFKWDDIEDIDDVELALSHDNDAVNIIWKPVEHVPVRERVVKSIDVFTRCAELSGENPDDNYSVKHDRMRLKSFDFVKEHMTQYFFANFS